MCVCVSLNAYCYRNHSHNLLLARSKVYSRRLSHILLLVGRKLNPKERQSERERENEMRKDWDTDESKLRMSEQYSCKLYGNRANGSSRFDLNSPLIIINPVFLGDIRFVLGFCCFCYEAQFFTLTAYFFATSIQSSYSCAGEVLHYA